MSGFEVVGVTLGAIPLLISALEHYSNGISIIESMANYETVFENLLNSLNTGLSIYYSSCEQLLGPLMLPGAQLQELLENTQSEAWKDEELNKKLRDRLGIQYEPYKSASHHLDKRIKLFNKKLKLSKDMKPLWVLRNGEVDLNARKKFFTSFWTRIRGGFKSDKYAKLLNDTLYDINQIAKLTEEAIKLEPLRLERQRRAEAKYWDNIRTQAKRLFENLHSRWSQCYNCKLTHQVNLRLDIRAGGEIEVKDSTANRRFCFTFSFDEAKVPSPPEPLPWRSLSVDIEPWEVTDTSQTPSAIDKSRGKRARFSDPVLPTFVLTSDTPPNTRLNSTTTMILPATKIDDLCTVLSRKIEKKISHTIGYLEDGSWQHVVYYSSNQPKKIPTTTLADVLYGSKESRLTPKQKCTLALTLASAVIQLHETPWLDESWTMKDIFITTDHQGLYQSYLTKTFHSKSSKQGQTSFQCFIQNRVVFSLGIALLELSYCQPILSLATPVDLDKDGNETIFTEFSIANRLIKEIEAQELPNYADATRRCVCCNFDTSKLSFCDPEFRELFYKGVILPLQKDHDYAHATSR